MMPARRELTMRQLRQMLRLHHDGVSAREIARTLGVARSTIQTILLVAELAENDPASAATRGAHYDQEKSGCRHRASQAAEEQGTSTWSDDQIATCCAYWKLGTQQRLVMEFALETVSRRGEVVRLGPQHVYRGAEGNRRIRIERTHGSADVDIHGAP